MKELEHYVPMTQGFSLPGAALQGSLYCSNRQWFCSFTSSWSTDNTKMSNSEHLHHDLKKEFKEKHSKEQQTRRAVVEVKVPAEHVEHYILVRLPVGCLEITDPFGHHVQLSAANLSFTWHKEAQLVTSQNQPGFKPLQVCVRWNMRVRLALWCVKMCAVKEANHLLPLLVLPDKHLHVRRATNCISAVLILRKWNKEQLLLEIFIFFF